MNVAWQGIQNKEVFNLLLEIMKYSEKNVCQQCK